jgi:hypothetical protein
VSLLTRISLDVATGFNLQSSVLDTESIPIRVNNILYVEESGLLDRNAVPFVVRVRRFGGTHCLHLQGRRASQARNQQKHTAS